MKKRIVTAMLATMMLLSTGTTALAASVTGGSTTSGNTTVTVKVENPIYKFSIPATLNAYIDPFEQLGNKASVTSDDYEIINKSNIPIQVDAEVKLTEKQGTTYKATEAEVKDEGTDKTAYVALEIPSTVTETTAQTAAKYLDPTNWTTELTLYKAAADATKYYVTDNSSANGSQQAVAAESYDTTDVKGTYTTSKKIAVDITDGTKLSFALKEAQYVDYYTNVDDTDPVGSAFKAVAADKKGSAVFRFSGKVNTLAAWSDGDITTTIAYTVTGLSDDVYATKAAQVGTDAHAYVSAKPSAATSMSTAVKSTAINGLAADATLNKVEVVKTDNSKVALTETTQYTFANNTFAIVTGKEALLSASSYTKFVLTFSNGDIVEIAIVAAS